MKRQSLMVPMLQVAALAWQFGCATAPAQHAPNFQTVTDSTAQEVAQRVAGTEKELHLVKALIARLDGELKARQERAEADLKNQVARTDADLKSQLAKTDADVRSRQERAEADLKNQVARTGQERKEDAQGFLRSQASLDTKLDELTAEVRLAQGRTEEIGHGVSELNRRFDELSSRIEQLGQRVSMIEKQVSRPGSESETASGTVGPAQADLTDPLDEGAGVEISVTVRTTDQTLAYYFVLIQDKITGNWTPPRVVPSTVGTINLSMKVLRSGQVRDLTLKSSSGDRLLDDSALRAVRLSTPLPPLPPLFKAETLFLELQFNAVSDRTTGKLQTRIEEEQASAATPSSAGKKATGQERPAGSREVSPQAQIGAGQPTDSLLSKPKHQLKEQQQNKRQGPVADNVLQAEGLCYEIEQQMSVLLMASTYTKCLPAAGTRPGTISLILISEKPVFSDDAAKKAWLIAVVGIVGKVARENPSIKLDNILVSDVASMKIRQVWGFPAATAKTLQRKVHDGEINIEQFIRGIYDALKEKSLPKRQ